MGKAAVMSLILLLAAISNSAHPAAGGPAPASAPGPNGNKCFQVEGDVYCDTCRVKFITELSHKLPDIKTGNLTYAAVAVAGDDGRYNTTVTGDHEDDICEVFAVKSPVMECGEPMKDMERSRVVCTANDGMHDDVRYANPVGFMTAAALPECRSVLDGFDMLPIEN